VYTVSFIVLGLGLEFVKMRQKICTWDWNKRGNAFALSFDFTACTFWIGMILGYGQILDMSKFCISANFGLIALTYTFWTITRKSKKIKMQRDNDQIEQN
jgi:F0F1-type ATP synthase assembly protein I